MLIQSLIFYSDVDSALSVSKADISHSDPDRKHGKIESARREELEELVKVKKPLTRGTVVHGSHGSMTGVSHSKTSLAASSFLERQNIKFQVKESLDSRTRKDGPTLKHGSLESTEKEGRDSFKNIIVHLNHIRSSVKQVENLLLDSSDADFYSSLLDSINYSDDHHSYSRGLLLKEKFLSSQSLSPSSNTCSKSLGWKTALFGRLKFERQEKNSRKKVSLPSSLPCLSPLFRNILRTFSPSFCYFVCLLLLSM
jgi:hypothetical protein